MTKIVIQKLDAASRQISTAIELWFKEADPISIHVLACSAYQIVHDINHKRGGRDLLYDSLVIKDEYRKEWIDRIKRTYNFLKHADRDPAETVEFDPVNNEFFILYTGLGLELLGVKPNIARAAFTLYQMLSRPDILTESGKADLEPFPQTMIQQALTMKKSTFFEQYTAYHRSLGRE